MYIPPSEPSANNTAGDSSSAIDNDDSEAHRAQGPATRASRLAKFTRTLKDFEFQDILDNFRRDKMAALYGRDALADLDAGIIMGDDELMRIADCAHCHKIASVEDLRRELSRWDGAGEYGQEIVALIKR